MVRLRAAVIHTAVLDENQRAGDLRVSFHVRSRLRQVTSGPGCALAALVSPPAPRLRSDPAQGEGLGGGGAGDALRGAGLTRGLSDGCGSRGLGRLPRGEGGPRSQEEKAPREQSVSRSGLLLRPKGLRKR